MSNGTNWNGDRRAEDGRTALAHLRAAALEAVALVRLPVGRRRLLILVSAVLVCSYALGVLSYVLSTPDIGLRCAFSPVIIRADAEALRGPTGSHLSEEQVREQVLNRPITRLGDREVHIWPDVLRGINDLRNRSEWLPADSPAILADPAATCVDLEGERLVRVVYEASPGGEDGQPPRLESVWCEVGPPPLETLTPSLLWFVLKIGLFVVGALVFWKRPEDRSAKCFFAVCIVTLGAYIGGYHWSRIVPQPVLLTVFMACSVLLPAVSLHFYLVFPRPKDLLLRRPRLVLALIYGPPLFFLAALLAGYLLARWLFNAGAPSAVGASRLPGVLSAILIVVYVYFAVSSLWYLASVICLVHSYRNARDVTERNQVKWILFGALAAVVPFGYSLYLAYGDPTRFGRGDATWPMFAASACFTVAFAISITRYRLMQLDQIISSGAVYFLVSFIAGLIYYVLVIVGMLVVGSRVFGEPSLQQALLVSGTALVLMLSLDLARGRLKNALDRHFRREKHQLDRTLQQMSQAVEQLVDPPALARRLLAASAELLGTSRGAVYLREGDPALFRLADHLGPTPQLGELPRGCPLVEALCQRPTLLGAVWPPTAADPAQRQLRLLGGEVALAVAHEGQVLALLLLGPKAVGPYVAEDLNLLAAFAQITALALTNAEGHRTIETLNRELQAKVEKIGEQQRRILALQNRLSALSDRHSAPSEWSLAKDKESSPAAAPTAGPADGRQPEADGRWGIIGSSPQIRHLLHLVRKVSGSQLAVLIRGESGTGKELLARALHEHSPRAGKPYVKVHCAALSPGLLESELFGHVKGAFTGAHKDKVGRFELADGGTLFLDEIGDISLEVQTKLLRVLQEKTFERVGSSDPVRVDVRVIAATHQDLEELIRRGRFREDLYYRLNGFPIHVPPLRERREDIPELALHFLRQYARRCGKDVVQMDDDALAVLKAYDWPGNVRQLENVLERAVVIAEGPVITAAELPAELVDAADASLADDEPTEVRPILAGQRGLHAEREERDRRERERLVRALAAAGGNKAEAARALGLARSTLVSRLKKHGLQ